MYPELFRIPGLNIPIFTYGLMMVIGFLLAAALAKFLARRAGLNAEVFVNAGIVALIAGVVGARLSHVLENWAVYTDPGRSAWENLKAAIDIRSGGLTFYGGFILATPVVLLYGWIKKVPLRRGMDVVAPCVMVGLALGRVGCFLNGCCYGATCYTDAIPTVTYPFGSPAYVDHYHQGILPKPPPPDLMVPLDNGGQILIPREHLPENKQLAAAAQGHHSAPTHPAQLYTTFNSLLIAAILVAFFSLSPAPGSVFALLLILEGIARFILEMLRTEPAVVGAGTGTWTFLPPLSFSMVVSVPLVIAGITMWLVFYRLDPRRRARLMTPSTPTTATA